MGLLGDVAKLFVKNTYVEVHEYGVFRDLMLICFVHIFLTLRRRDCGVSLVEPVSLRVGGSLHASSNSANSNSSSSSSFSLAQLQADLLGVPVLRPAALVAETAALGAAIAGELSHDKEHLDNSNKKIGNSLVLQ